MMYNVLRNGKEGVYVEVDPFLIRKYFATYDSNKNKKFIFC